MGVQVDVLVAGEIAMPSAYVFRSEGGNAFTRFAGLLKPGGETLTAPLLAYVVRHPSAGTLLIDTGLHPDALQSVRRDYGALMSSVIFRGLRPSDQSFDVQLRALGVEPGEVERVVMTHLHVDHTSGMRLLPRAEFLCGPGEHAAATARGAAAKGFRAAHLPDASRFRAVDFAGEGEQYGPFAQTVDLLGDGSVRLISTPGHTPGHMSVLLRAEAGREVLVVGDAAYTVRSIREQLLPLIVDDTERYRRSLADLRAFADQHPDAVLVPTHDPDAYTALSHVEVASS